jgi:hypothetical protein
VKTWANENIDEIKMPFHFIKNESFGEMFDETLINTRNKERNLWRHENCRT